MSYLLGKPVNEFITAVRLFSGTIPTAQVLTLGTTPVIIAPAQPGIFYLPLCGFFYKEAGIGYGSGGISEIGLHWTNTLIACTTNPSSFLNPNGVVRCFTFGLGGTGDQYYGELSTTFGTSILGAALVFSAGGGSNPSSGVGSIIYNTVVAIFQYPFTF